jgi:hypothetical protein
VVSFLVVMLSTLFLTIIVALPPADAEQGFQRVAVYGGHVTLEVPTDWEEIPPDLLESHSLKMAEATGGRLTEIYQYGFRARDPDIEFVFPECLIQIRESGRLNYRRFLELPSVEEMRLAGEKNLAERRGFTTPDLELSEAFFDGETFSLHVSNVLDLRYEKETTVTSVAFLTEHGLMTIHFYAPSEQVGTMAPVYQHIVNSVHFDTELRYRPRLRDYLPRKLPLILLAFAAVIALVGAMLSVYQRKRRQR